MEEKENNVLTTRTPTCLIYIRRLTDSNSAITSEKVNPLEFLFLEQIATRAIWFASFRKNNFPLIPRRTDVFLFSGIITYATVIDGTHQKPAC